MATPITSTTHSSADFNVKGTSRTFFNSCAGFVERMNAAINVARSVENRRAPLRRDLNILGIDGDLPRF